jgi:hypothetical protein
LNPKAAAKVATALTRLSAGNFSNVKGVGSLANWQDYKRRKKEDNDGPDTRL